MRPKTAAIHAGHSPEDHLGAVMPPIYQTSTFAYRGVNQPGAFSYSRSGNPTRKALEDCLATLEGGTRGFAFATGMAAEATVVMLMRAGDRVLVQNHIYGGTYRLFENVFRDKGISAEYADLRDADALERTLAERPAAAIWIETPANPLMDLVDLAAVAKAARARGVLTICDNTFLSPYFQRPLDFGIDIALHSTTKYLNGHSDVVGGGAVVKDEQLGRRIAYLQNALGTGAGPQDCFLVLRGIRTLPIRMEEHNRNALALARWLEKHPRVAEVLHPGLESHPQHELARRQMTGYGGTFSFRLRGGEEAVHRLLGGVRLFTLAESLGGVESLIGYPKTMTHASVPAEIRQQMGIGEDLVRVSVGLEDIDDLIADIDAALGS
jgi:cystathionine gamma-lyase